jgi:hypothetical protein
LQNVICTFSCFMFLLKLRDFQGVGYGFFWKKIFWFPMLLKKIFWFWWKKKK